MALATTSILYQIQNAPTEAQAQKLLRRVAERLDRFNAKYVRRCAWGVLARERALQDAQVHRGN